MFKQGRHQDPDEDTSEQAYHNFDKSPTPFKYTF